MLGLKYKVTETVNGTKDRILLESARLFAVKGYHLVSMKDIADAVNVKPASIYNHYAGKFDILDCIFDKSHELFDAYYTRLEEESEKVQSLEEVIENMFVELKTVTTLFTYYAVCAAMSLQYENEKARSLYFEHMLHNGRNRVKKLLDDSIHKGFAEPFDTGVVAHMIMDSVIVGNGLRVGERESGYEDQHLKEKYTALCNFIIRAARAGI